MAEPITMQKLTDASLDADTLGEFANEDKTVVSRKGLEYPSAPMASRLVVENGLLGATPFASAASMGASSLVDGDYAIVTDDSNLAKNGFWQKQAGVWQLLKWNPIEQAKEYVNSNPLFKPQRLEPTTDLDALFTAGIYHVPIDSTAAALGLPTGQYGQIYVSGNTKTDNTGYVFQTYIARNGSVYQRIFSGSFWLDWQGNDASLLIKKGEQTKSIVTYGSSTLAYLADELQTFSDNKGIELYPYAISGDTIAGTGMLSGANKVTIKVTGGELIKDTYVPVTYTKSFGKNGTNVDFKLDNGVTGKLDVFNSKFKASSNATVSPSTVFNAKPLAERPADATYLINSGKNDVSATVDNTQYVIEKTDEIVRGLPFGVEFIVLGHFADINSSVAETNYINIINAALKTKYGLRYLSINDILFDDATWSKLGLTKTAADNTAIAKGNLPPSLSRDNGHLSAAMDVVLSDSIIAAFDTDERHKSYTDSAIDSANANTANMVSQVNSSLTDLQSSIGNNAVVLKSLSGVSDAVANGAVVGDVYYRVNTNGFYKIHSVSNGSGQASPIEFSTNTLFKYDQNIYDISTGSLKKTSRVTNIKILALLSLTDLSDAIANGAKVGDYYYNSLLSEIYQITDISGTDGSAVIYPIDKDTIYINGNSYYFFNGTALNELQTEKSSLNFEKIYSMVDLSDAIANGAEVGDVYYNSAAGLFELFRITSISGSTGTTKPYSFKDNTIYICDGVLYSLVGARLKPILGGDPVSTFELKSVIDLKDAVRHGAKVGDVYYHHKLKGLYEIDSVVGDGGSAQPTAFKKASVLYSCEDVLYYYNGDALVSLDTASATGLLGNRQIIEPTPEDSISAYINGLKFADELDNHLVELTRPVDRFGHTASFVFYNDICYATLMVNTRGAGETPTQMSVVLCSFPVSNPSNVTYYEICDIGDTVLTETVAKNYDPVLFIKNDTIHILWNSVLGSDVEYTLLHQTFSPATSEFSGISVSQLKVKDTTVDLTSDGINDAFAAEGIKTPEFKEHIVLMGNATPRVEGNTTYYYTAIGGKYGNNMIVKTVDFITWVYVAQPSFENVGQYEPTAYVIGDDVYYYCRQSISPYGFLTKYSITKNTWTDPVYIPEAQSRSQFFMYNSQLYLIYAPKDRHHLGIVQIDTRYLVRSRIVQVARVAGLYAYPAVDVNNGILYALFSDNKEKLYVSNFTIESIGSDDIKTTFKQLFAI